MTRPAQSFWANNGKCPPMSLSPVEQRQKELPQGNGNWPGADYVYRKLQEAAHHLAKHKTTYLSADHIECMAVMGSGHEETMKYQMAIAFTYGWAKP